MNDEELKKRLEALQFSLYVIVGLLSVILFHSCK